MKKIIAFISVCLCVLTLCGCSGSFGTQQVSYSASLEDIPQFSDQPYVLINNNQPEFTQAEITERSFEQYSRLDSLDRCGVAMACVGVDLMPTEDRGDISSIKPTGWVNKPYDFVDGEYLYNRCHLLGFQLTGENANERNLITGTRYMNVEGMLPFENMVADYVKETGNHVMYRVTPVFHGSDLVASGVQLEAWSVEDQGAGVCFNVYAYNVQPGVTIDYATGENWQTAAGSQSTETQGSYILNTNSKKFHLTSCEQADNISKKNREAYTGSRQSLIDEGYVPAGCCDP